MIAFDANFNRMDDGIMQNQYIGKDLAALQSSIDSMTYRVDSIGNNYANSLKVSGYFSLYDRPGMHVSKEDSIREQKAVAEAAELNLDSLFDGGSLNASSCIWTVPWQEPDDINRIMNFAAIRWVMKIKSSGVTRSRCTKSLRFRLPVSFSFS